MINELAVRAAPHGYLQYPTAVQQLVGDAAVGSRVEGDKALVDGIGGHQPQGELMASNGVLVLAPQTIQQVNRYGHGLGGWHRSGRHTRAQPACEREVKERSSHTKC